MLFMTHYNQFSILLYVLGENITMFEDPFMILMILFSELMRMQATQPDKQNAAVTNSRWNTT